MKDRTILAIKGLAIIGVVYHHLGGRRTDPSMISEVNAVVFVFHWCVLAFVMVSGYLQALSDSKKQRSLLEFTRTRIMRLLVPFVVLVFVYSCVWQMLQALHIPNIATKIPPDFIGKLESGLWPVNSQIAEQLYFFPLLFGVSILLVIVQKLTGIYGIWVAAIVPAIPGMLYYPNDLTGFLWGVFLWSISFYASGYLLFHYRTRKPAIRLTLLACTVILVAVTGWEGLVISIPLWLLAEGATLRLDRVPLLVSLGEASGTIYIYHTPFMVRFLVITAGFIPVGQLQFLALNIDAWIAIGLCSLIYFSLKNTRAKVLLM